MTHPYKQFSEHRHGRDVAKKRGYQSGGGVREFPISARDSDLQRLRSAQGVESGRIPTGGGNVAMGPGMSRSGGGPKPSWIRRASERQQDMPMAKGGSVHSDEAQDKAMIRKAMTEHDKQLHGGKHTKLALKSGGSIAKLKMTAGARSGVGRLQKAHIAAKNR